MAASELNLLDWRRAAALIRSEAAAEAPAPPPPTDTLVWAVERTELLRRKLALEMEGLRLYEPLPLAEKLHRCTAQWVIADGCLDGSQEIYDPVQKSLRRVDSIDDDFHVYSISPETGRREIHQASKPFVKGYADMYRLTLSNGQTISGTLGHRVVAADGRWITLADAMDGRPLAESHDDSILRRTLRASRQAIEEHQRAGGCCTTHSGSRRSTLTGATVAGEERRHASIAIDEQYLVCSPTRQQHSQALALAARTFPSRPQWEETRIASFALLRESASCRLLSTLDTYLSRSLASALRWLRIGRDCLGRCFLYRRPCDEQPRSEEDGDRASSPSRDDAHERSLCRSHRDGLGRSVQYTRSYQPLLRPSIPDAQHPVADRFLAARCQTASLDEELAFGSSRTSSRSPTATPFAQDTSSEESPHQEHSDAFASSHPPLFHGINSTVNCVRVEYLGQGPIWDISVPPHANYLAGGLINANSNRAGKSLSCAAEGAFALCGCHPHGKYVQRNGLAWLVGLKEKHLILMYDTLFREGAFKLIQDEQTRIWRTVRWDRDNPTKLAAYDEAYREKWKDAPPLIPPRLVDNEAWSDKAQGIPSAHRFKNGWRIVWSTGLGVPEQGQHWNFVWFDEELTNPLHYREAHRGLTRLGETRQRAPHGIWSATAQAGNPELSELRDKATKDPDSPFARRFVFHIEENPYLTAEDRASFREGLSDDDIATRYDGIAAATHRRIYPHYNPMGPHGCEPFDIPGDWCHWFVTDPGRMHCATLFAAVDPLRQWLTIYGGFDLRNSDAHAWAAEIRRHELRIGKRFEGAIFDQQRGKQTLDSLFSKTVAEQYWEALVATGVSPRTYGQLAGLGGFWPGLNNVEARERAMIEMMAVRASGPFAGSARFRVVRGAIPALDKQIAQAHTDPDNPEKRWKNKYQPSDLVEACEYLAAFDPPYHRPEPPQQTPVSPALAAFRDKQKFLQKSRDNRSHLAALRRRQAITP